jgi:hypothetical protein
VRSTELAKVNPHALPDPSMTLPLNFTLNAPAVPAVPAVPAWLSGERTLVLAIGLVALCAALVLCLHG